MKSILIYKIISKVYDLLDVFYFRKSDTSPRTSVNQYLGRKKLEILDICTGTAANAISIVKTDPAAKVIGIDISRDMLKIAEKKVQKYELPHIKLYEMDATNTKFQNETFDIVLISLVLHEISDELAKKMITEAKRVLKKNGKIIVVEWEKPKSVFQKMMFFPIMVMEPKGFKRFLNLNMKDYFNRYGLNMIDIRHCDYTKVIVLQLFNKC